MKGEKNLLCAWIVGSVDRGRKPIKNGKIYLNNYDEFEIEIFNPLTNTIKADIYINGNPATNGGLIIRPGKRQYLDCFTSNRKKFTFNTYDVEDTKEFKSAIEKNGKVEIFFYLEKTIPIVSLPQFQSYPYPLWVYSPSHYSGQQGEGLNPNYYSGGCQGPHGPQGFSGPMGYSGIQYNLTSSSLNSRSLSGSRSFTKKLTGKIETGRIEGGSVSNQNFINVDMEFELVAINQISYQILPASIRPIEVSELKRNFCSQCGRKLKNSFKFCPDCGTEL